MTDDFLSSAARHFDNSKFLAHWDRWQEAAYLSGYAAECSLKGFIEKGNVMGRPFGHRLDELAGDGLQMAFLMNPLLRRLPKILLSGLVGWNETLRYERTDSTRDLDYHQIVSNSHEIASTILISLTLDGFEQEIPQ